MAQKTAPDQSYYQILELQPTARLQEIKKAYRKLALQHHPDRNPAAKKEAATVKFRQVNEAYEVLSDPDQRRQYDAELRTGRPLASSPRDSGNQPFYPPSSGHRRYGRPHRDPFHQFNDLFQNDPFFNEAFKDMDDLFAKTFQQQHPNNRTVSIPPPPQQKSFWGRHRWIADCLGCSDFTITTSTTRIGADGRPQTSRTHTSYGGSGRSSYTSKSSRTVIENGQRITIQSLERDGNKIEEKYIHNQMVQRLINGVPQPQLEGGLVEFDL